MTIRTCGPANTTSRLSLSIGLASRGRQAAALRALAGQLDHPSLHRVSPIVFIQVSRPSPARQAPPGRWGLKRCHVRPSHSSLRRVWSRRRPSVYVTGGSIQNMSGAASGHPPGRRSYLVRVAPGLDEGHVVSQKHASAGVDLARSADEAIAGGRTSRHCSIRAASSSAASYGAVCSWYM